MPPPASQDPSATRLPQAPCPPPAPRPSRSPSHPLIPRTTSPPGHGGLPGQSATPAISWQSPSPITYGSALGPAQLNATASVPGSFSYSPAAGSVPAAGSQTLSLTFTPTDTKDYKPASATVAFQVNQATPAISWQSPSPITYGSALGPAQLNATASVPGSFSYSPAAGSVPAAGSQTLSLTFSPVDSINYTLVTSTVSLFVSLPVISSANVMISNPAYVVFDVIGTGFVSQSAVMVDGYEASTLFVSSTELQATISQSTGSASTVELTVNNPAPGAVASNSMEVTLPPSYLHQLVGCANPNNPQVNVPTGDWGTTSDTEYFPLTHTTPLIGSPLYFSNTIFWISREAVPGDSILMTGAFTGDEKSAKVAFIPDGTIDWQSVVRDTGQSVPTTQQGTTGLSFIVPPRLPAGVYGFEIDDPSAAPILSLANAPSIEWAVGVPSTTTPGTGLQSQMHDCGVEPGEFLRIFGKNFLSLNQVVLESPDGSISSISPSRVDANSIVAEIPSGLPTGTYYVWVGDAPWSATSSLPIAITVVSPPSPAISQVECSALVGDGQTDNSSLLQSCLDQYAPKAGGSNSIYLGIPNGQFVLTHGVTIRSGEVLLGSSPSDTQFLGNSPDPQPNAWFTIPQYAGMANLSIKAANALFLVAASDLTGNPTTSGHVVLNNMVFDSTPSGSNSNTWNMVTLSGPDIQVYGSTFSSGTWGGLSILQGDGAIISGNTFVNNPGMNYFQSSQNMIIENNLVYSESGPGPTTNPNGSSAFDLSREFSCNAPSRVTRNEYIGYNTIQNMSTAGLNMFAIQMDGGAGAYYGFVESATADSVVLAEDPSWIHTGTGDLEGVSVAIVLGTGVGQQSFIRSVSGRTITVMTPWKVTPDSTSVVVITSSEQNLIIAHNTLENTLGISIHLARAVDSVVEDNVLSNSGSGILVGDSGPYGGPAAFNPVMNSDVLRNEIAVGSGNFIVPSPSENAGGIGILDNWGVMISGAIIRHNELPTLQTIYDTNGWNGINAIVIERNTANWVGPGFSVPGFLVQNNVSP